MCNELEDLIKNNPNVTLSEYAWAHAKALLVKWEWIKESDPTPTSIAIDPEHEQKLAQARKLVQDKLAMSDEDAQKSYERYREEQRLIGARSRELLTQAEAWKLSCEDQTFRDVVVKHLRETIESNEPVTAIAGKILPDGRELAVIPRIYNTIITIGPAGSGFYDDHW